MPKAKREPKNRRAREQSEDQFGVLRYVLVVVIALKKKKEEEH